MRDSDKERCKECGCIHSVGCKVCGCLCPKENGKCKCCALSKRIT